MTESRGPALGVLGGSEPKIAFSIPLAWHEYEKLLQDLGTVQAVSYQQQYALVERNHRKLVSLRHYLGNAFEHGQQQSGATMAEAIFAFNSELLNWLMSFRLLIDHYSTELKRTYGRKSVALQTFQDVETAQLSKKPGYRLMAKMRDFAQHCGFPISSGSLRLRNGWDKSDGVVVEFLCDREDLLRDYKDWDSLEQKSGGQRVTSDLAALDDQFEIMDFTEECMIGVRKIHWSVVDQKVLAAAEVGQSLLDAAERLASETTDGAGVALLYWPGGGNLRSSSIPVEFIRKLLYAAHQPNPSGFVQEMEGVQPQRPVPLSTEDKEFAGRVRVGAFVLGQYLEFGFSERFDAEVEKLAEQYPNGAVTEGVVAIGAIALMMVSSLRGTTPEDFLGSIASRGV